MAMYLCIIALMTIESHYLNNILFINIIRRNYRGVFFSSQFGVTLQVINMIIIASHYSSHKCQKEKLAGTVAFHSLYVKYACIRILSQNLNKILHFLPLVWHIIVFAYPAPILRG